MRFHLVVHHGCHPGLGASGLVAFRLESVQDTLVVGNYCFVLESVDSRYIAMYPCGHLTVMPICGCFSSCCHSIGNLKYLVFCSITISVHWT